MTDVLDAPATTPLGQPIKRTEDPRFITGKGRYLDDIKLQSMTHMAILRSPYAHANIRSVDTTGAKSMPGVIAVFTGEDILLGQRAFLTYGLMEFGSFRLCSNIPVPFSCSLQL